MEPADGRKIGDLKHMLRSERPPTSQPSWLFHAPSIEDPPLCSSLPASASDFLMHTFNANVDQFVRILHKPTIQTKLNQFRRGVLADGHDFSCQLSAIYNLAVLSLSNDDCVATIGQPRESLLVRFKTDVEQGIGNLHITISHNISSLQTLLLHIVSFLPHL